MTRTITKAAMQRGMIRRRPNKDKQKKAKKPKVTVVEAAAKIEAYDLSIILSSVSFQREASVVAKIVNVSVSYISESVYTRSVK
ncbi:hypothetical protein CASFOL_004849 [Castilleja foliolosa]|uniref:Uncharacterized protein n=1 Tax=Castilleja foliolosa TaxID=1961234 RepID=A0ABD3EDN7_9LAMI